MQVDHKATECATSRDPRPPTALGEEQFERLFEEYSGIVYGFFANRGFSKEESRDLTQETFLRVFARRKTFRGDSSLETWLYSVSTNIWRNAIRARGRQKRQGEVISLEEVREAEGLDPIAMTHEGKPLDCALREERTRVVREALEDLPELMRFCILLRLDQGLPYREIAMVLEISVDTVKSQLFQAKAKLRKRLARYFQDGH